MRDAGEGAIEAGRHGGLQCRGDASAMQALPARASGHLRRVPRRALALLQERERCGGAALQIPPGRAKGAAAGPRHNTFPAPVEQPGREPLSPLCGFLVSAISVDYVKIHFGKLNNKTVV